MAKYTEKFSLEIKSDEFYKNVIPRVPKRELQKHLRMELYHCWNGITEGEWGGSAIDWEEHVYYHLWNQGYIYQTEYNKGKYGDFEKDRINR